MTQTENNLNDFELEHLQDVLPELNKYGLTHRIVQAMKEHHASLIAKAGKELPTMKMYEKVKATFPDQVYVWFHSEASAALASRDAEIERLKRQIRIARGTLGYGDLNTEPETILQVRTILDSALTNPER